MKLARIRALIEQYEQKLIDGILSDEELDSLLDAKTFAQSPEDFDADLQLEGENYSTREAMQIFVLKITSAIGATKLYEFINKIIARTISVSNPDAFLQQPSLIKYFFAYASKNHPVKNDSTLEFSDVMNLWFEKLNLTTTHQNAVTQSIINHASHLEYITKEKKPESLDAIATEVVALTTEKPGLTALDFGPFTPTAPATNPYAHNMLAKNAETKNRKTPPLFCDRMNERMRLITRKRPIINALRPYHDHYNSTIVQTHQAFFHPEKRKEGILEAEVKASVAYALIDYLSQYTPTDIMLQEKFAGILKLKKLSAEDFFYVSNEKVKLPEDIQKLLSPETPYIKSTLEQREDQKALSSTNDAPTATENKERFSRFTKMFVSSSSASAVSNNPNESFIAELDPYISHYGSITTQAHQAIFNSSKKTSTGILESVAKTKIATRIKLAFENQESNIPELFTTLLAEYGLNHNSDAFFAGTKEKAKLSDALKIFLTGGGKTLGMTLSASGDNQG